jgi:uncharacterized protein (DUF58 family)
MRSSIGRLRLLGGLICFLFLLGLATRSSEVLALAVLPAVYLAVALWHAPEQVDLRVSRSLSADRVHQESPVRVHLSIHNHGPRLEEVLLEDLVPPSLEIVAGESRVLGSLPAGATTEMNYTVTGPRGDYAFEGIQATGGERLGLIRRQRIVPAPARLSIMPNPVRLRRLAIRPARTRGYAGPVPSRQGGSGTDFLSVREYQLGDPRHSINWRLSARHPTTLFTNEFERERIADVGLILDARERTDIHLPTGPLFEHAVEATAALADTFLREGNRVGLLVYGELLDWTFPGYGKVQRERILRSLARARTGKSLVFEHLDYLPTQLFPAQSQIVLISPLCWDDLPTLLRLRARGYQLLIVRPDAIAFELHAAEGQPGAEMAGRIVALERKLMLSKMQQAGVRVVDWQVDQPFDRTMHTSLARMARAVRTVAVEQIR